MKEIVVISGKGGTGKTSLTASFAALADGHAVIADCDVDAADMHLILKPDILRNTPFVSGRKAVIDVSSCTGCGRCGQVCRFGAVARDGTEKYTVNIVACEGCGTCVRFCPQGAISFPEQQCGEWYISSTRFGSMVHAKLGIASENSGRLVTLVRNEAKRIAREQGADYLLIDGSPGIGCSVIASLTATHFALIVTEPTVSGIHDLERIAGLTVKLGVPAMVCVNKWDINPEKTEEIIRFTEKRGLLYAGGVRYDRMVTETQRQGKAVVELGTHGVAGEIECIWRSVYRAISG